MSKKIVGFISACELVIAIIMYFAIAYHFDNDKIIMSILPYINFEATLLRLLIYIVPGINIISGLFGIVFSTKGLLVFMGLLEILAGSLTMYYKGKSDFMNIMAIIMIVLGILFIIFTLLSKTKKEITK